MRDDELAGEAKRLIDAIAAAPRFAGSAEEAKARAWCADELRRAEFSTVERKFEFSEWPGRWGIPLIAGWILIGILLIAAGSDRDAHLGNLAFISVFVLGMYSAGRRRNLAARDTRWLRSASENLEGTRGAPTVWLTAHLDSKSQSVPMLLRVASHIALIAVVVVEIATLYLSQIGFGGSPHWGWFAIAGIVAAVPSLLCFVGNKSRGALDNASGVAAVLLAARIIPETIPIGIVITSGEELDLAGARVWASQSHRAAVMINCDTIDDEGGWRCMSRNRPHSLGMAAEKAAKKLGLALRMGNVIPGIITDSLAFEVAGLSAVTISRGTLRTLARLHTRGDNPDRVSGAGSATAARLLAQMVEELS